LYKNVIAVHVDGVRPCLWTVATSGPTVHPPRWCMSMEPWCNDVDGGRLKILERDLLQCHFLRHKSHMEWSGPQQRGHHLTARAMAQPVYKNIQDLSEKTFQLWEIDSQHCQHSPNTAELGDTKYSDVCYVVW
jgi:hypothetical protein